MLLKTRRWLPGIIVAVCVAMSLCGSPAQAQDRSAAQLLDQGIKLYDQGDYAQAAAALDRIDPVQLDRNQRSKFNEVSAAVGVAVSAQQTLTAAAEAEKNYDAKKAMDLYKVVQSNRKAPKAMRATALAGMARVEKWLKSGVQATQAQAQAQKADQAATDKAQAEAKAKAEADAKAKAEADAKAAAAKARMEAEAAANKNDTAAQKAAAAKLTDAQAKVAAAAKARAAAEKELAAAAEARKAAEGKLAAADKARMEAEAKAKKEAEAAAKAQAEAKKLAEANKEAQAKLAAAEKARKEAEAKAEKEAEAAAKAKADADKMAKAAADKARKETEAKAKKEAEEKAKAEALAAAKAKKEAEAKAKAQAEAKAKAEAAAREKLIQQAMVLNVQRLVAEGDAAAKKGNYALAKENYQKALAQDPENAAAAKGLAAVKAAPGADDAPLVPVIREQKLGYQRALALYNDAMKNADAAMATGNFAAASDAAVLAKSVLDTNRRYFSDLEYSQLRQAALDKAAAVQTSADIQQRQDIKEQEVRLQEQQRILAEKTAREQAEKVNELLQRASDLAREQKYAEALEHVDQVLFIDPNNVSGQFMKDFFTDEVLYIQSRELRKQRAVNSAKHRNDLERDTVPDHDLMSYPPDWPQLTMLRRGFVEGTAGETELDRRTRERLLQPIPVDFDANQFQNVIEYLRNVTGVNFVVNWRALQAVNIRRDDPVTLQLSNVAAEKALRLILDQVGGEEVKLSYTVDEGVVLIATKEFLAEKTAIRTYDIRDLIVQIPDFSDAPEFNLDQIASDAGDGGGNIFGGDNDTDQDQIPQGELISRIQDLIRNTVDPDGWRATGGLNSSMEELSGTLIVNTTAENHKQIGALLGQLRETRALQISIDARFLLVTQNFLEEVGVDVDLAIGHDESWVESPIRLGNNTANLAVAQATGVGGTMAPVAFPSFFVADAAGGPITFFLDDLQLDLLIRATLQDQRSTVVNTPRLTFFNGQRAYITVARQQAFVSDLEPVGSGDAIAFDPEIDVVSDGVVLDVEGTISADRRYVTMTVRPSLAQLEGMATFSISSSFAIDNDADTQTDEDPIDLVDNDGDTLIDEDPVDVGSASIQQPILQLTTLRTSVSVPDKGTLMLGGQRLMGEVEVEAGVPILSKIPILNRLFTNRATTRDERTLLVLIKPTIIVQSEHEDRLFPGLNQSPGLFNLTNQPMP